MAPREDDAVYLGATLESGFSVWDTMAGSLERGWSKASTDIESVHAAAPWGDGPEGRAFLNAYMMNDGPAQLVETGTELVQHIAVAGVALRRTIANSRGTEAAIAEDLGRRQLVREA